jgi:hypothetical protein
LHTIFATLSVIFFIISWEHRSAKKKSGSSTTYTCNKIIFEKILKSKFVHQPAWWREGDRFWDISEEEGAFPSSY